MNLNERNLHANAAVSVACATAMPNVTLDRTASDFCLAYLLGEYGGLTAALMCAEPYYAAMFIEKVLGIDPYRMADDFDRRIRQAEDAA